MSKLVKIISGGQTGADQAGLAAARELGLDTGGYMPRGWLTEDGPRRDLAQEYNLGQSETENYSRRTRLNVDVSDGTLIFGNIDSPGSSLTKNLCLKYGRPMFHCPWRPGDPEILTDGVLIRTFRLWLTEDEIALLNVAGNRESKAPGIFNACKAFLLQALKP